MTPLISTSYPTFGSPMPTRTWSDPNVKYKYGFNGKEKDNEINVDGGDYDFGARIYDSRLGRWLACDPFMLKYSNLSPYCYSENSPILLNDPNGKEPIKPNVVKLSDMMTTLQKVTIKETSTYITCSYPFFVTYTTTKGITTLDELREHFGSGMGGSDNGQGDPNRYLYSKKWGWIDMKHVTTAAAQADNVLLTGQEVLNQGEQVELRQENNQWPNNNPQSEESAWDYEDLVSNLIGVGFEKYLETTAAEGKDLLTNLNNYLTDLGFAPDPSAKGIDGTSPKDKVAENHGNEIGPPNYTYDPMNAPDIDKRTNTTDKLVVDIQKKREETTGKDTRAYQVLENEKIGSCD